MSSFALVGSTSLFIHDIAPRTLLQGPSMEGETTMNIWNQVPRKVDMIITAKDRTQPTPKL
jgi:hypothetical protein